LRAQEIKAFDIPHAPALALLAAADLARAEKDFEGAIASAQRLVMLLTESRAPALLPEARLHLGRGLLGLGRLDEAQASLEQALSDAENLGALNERAWAMAELASLAGRRGDPESASRWAARARAAFTELADLAGSEELAASLLALSGVRAVFSVADAPQEPPGDHEP
jgi:tetratricopeptide (TPR) repeat protein